jgi:hypothetical protein
MSMAVAEWEAIKHVSGAATLIAFVVATSASVLRRRIRAREKLIALAPEQYRPRLIDKALGVFVPIDVAEKERAPLFRAQLRHRERQLRATFIFLIVLGLLAATTFIGSLLLQKPAKPTFGALIYEQWKDDQSDFVNEYGIPADNHEINVWFQFFTAGMVLHNVPGNVSWALSNRSGTYQKYPNPDRLISEHNKAEIDWTLFDQICKATPEQREPYRELIRNRSIIGGIGTLYVSEALLPSIGPPQPLGGVRGGTHKEDLMTDVLYSRGPNYDLVLGLPNRAADNAGDRITRAGFALFRNGKFQKFVVNLNDQRRALAGPG